MNDIDDDISANLAGNFAKFASEPNETADDAPMAPSEVNTPSDATESQPIESDDSTDENNEPSPDEAGMIADADDDTSDDNEMLQAENEPAVQADQVAEEVTLHSNDDLAAPAVAAEPTPAVDSEPKPRICLMGEFSAGKSTLSNFLIGGSALPVNVTATQLPPVWISHGSETPYRVDLDGGEYDVDLNNLSDVSVDDTSHIRIFSDAELLKTCDLIDMPGISDPNMAPEVWQRVVHHADAVIWCTHATQAWRQSEAAVWSMMTPSLYEKSFLLLTRIDKITSERDKERVVRRVGRETSGLFREIFPVSLLNAVKADGDEALIEASGASAFKDALDTLLRELNGVETGLSTAQAHDAILGAASEGPARNVIPRRVRSRKLTARKLTRRTALPAPSEEGAQL